MKDVHISTEELILMNGPPFVGVEQFVQENLPSSHKIIIPSKLFTEDQSIGLRDIGLRIVNHIQQGEKVVVLDGNELRRVRESYIKLIAKKVFWTREWTLANCVQMKSTCMKISDSSIYKWFDKHTDVDITYTSGVVDAVKESEGCSIETHTVVLSAQSTYKWEVPALLLQLELLMTCEENEKQVSLIKDILCKWTDKNPCGRIIVVCDGNRIATGETTKQQEMGEIKETIGHISREFTDNVVFVYHIDDPNQAGCFVQPSNPGILAYIQYRHCLNLHSKNTVYLYESADHLKMAEKAGVRHLKGSRVMKYPALVISQSAATIPSISDMLGSVNLRPCDAMSDHSPTIPLYDQQNRYTDGMIYNNIGNGRAEYVFMKDWTIFERLHQLYMNSATKVGQAGSKMSAEKNDQSGGFIPMTLDLNQSKTSLTSRDLPKWMLGREESKSSRSSSLDTPLTRDNSGNADNSARKTVYMLTDHELVETAIEVLKQAGKTDLIEKFKSNHGQLGKKEGQDYDSDEQMSAVSNNRNQKLSVSKIRHDKLSVTHSSQYDSESLSSVCPKMEPELDDELMSQDVHKAQERQQVFETEKKLGLKSGVKSRQSFSGVSNAPDTTNYTDFRNEPKRSRKMNQTDTIQDYGGYRKSKMRKTIDDSFQGDNCESDESFDCASTESSQDEGESLDIDSDDGDELLLPLLDGSRNREERTKTDVVKVKSEMLNDKLLVDSRQTVEQRKRDVVEVKSEVLNDSADDSTSTYNVHGNKYKITGKTKDTRTSKYDIQNDTSEKRDLKEKSSNLQKNRKTPDLSILDEIFS